MGTDSISARVPLNWPHKIPGAITIVDKGEMKDKHRRKVFETRVPDFDR